MHRGRMTNFPEIEVPSGLTGSTGSDNGARSGTLRRHTRYVPFGDANCHRGPSAPTWAEISPRRTKITRYTWVCFCTGLSELEEHSLRQIKLTIRQ